MTTDKQNQRLLSQRLPTKFACKGSHFPTKKIIENCHFLPRSKDVKLSIVVYKSLIAPAKSFNVRHNVYLVVTSSLLRFSNIRLR